MTVTQTIVRTCYYCDEPVYGDPGAKKPLCSECQEADTNEQTAQAFTAQVKKEQEAVLALLKKWGVKPS